MLPAEAKRRRWGDGLGPVKSWDPSKNTTTSAASLARHAPVGDARGGGEPPVPWHREGTARAAQQGVSALMPAPLPTGTSQGQMTWVATRSAPAPLLQVGAMRPSTHPPYFLNPMRAELHPSQRTHSLEEGTNPPEAHTQELMVYCQVTRLGAPPVVHPHYPDPSTPFSLRNAEHTISSSAPAEVCSSSQALGYLMAQTPGARWPHFVSAQDWQSTSLLGASADSRAAAAVSALQELPQNFSTALGHTGALSRPKATRGPLLFGALSLPRSQHSAPMSARPTAGQPQADTRPPALPACPGGVHDTRAFKGVTHATSELDLTEEGSEFTKQASPTAGPRRVPTRKLRPSASLPAAASTANVPPVVLPMREKASQREGSTRELVTTLSKRRQMDLPQVSDGGGVLRAAWEKFVDANQVEEPQHVPRSSKREEGEQPFRTMRLFGVDIQQDFAGTGASVFTLGLLEPRQTNHINPGRGGHSI